MHELDMIFKLEIDGRKEVKICEKEGESYFLIKQGGSTKLMIKYDDEQETTITTEDREEIKKHWDILMNDDCCTGGHKLRTLNAVRIIKGLDPLTK